LFHEEWRLDGGRDRLDTNRAVELYDLNTDLGERNDLARRNPAKRDEMLGRMLAWIKDTGALIPSERNPRYAPPAPGAAPAQGGKKSKSD
ncbi:MAG: aryl-sulfate sulfohydrolase, partial [Opitutaceae bacterium]